MTREIHRFLLTCLVFSSATLTGIGESRGDFHVQLVSPMPATNGFFGTAVAAVPDLNGDGVSDLAVGAPGEGASATGQVHLYSGANGTFLRTLSPPNGGSTSGLFGAAVIGSPDVDGDGMGDVVVGAPMESVPAGVARAGRVHVFSGATGALIRTVLAAVPTIDSRFGASLSLVPDVNGDGRADLLAGSSWGFNLNGTTNGKVTITDLTSGVALRTLASPATTALTLSYGISVTGVPDINGDGRGDVIVGSPDESTPNGTSAAGRVHVYSGSTGALIRTVVSPAPSSGGRFGNAVLGMADITGDGHAEVVISAPRELTNRGRVRLFDAVTGVMTWVADGPSGIGLASMSFGLSLGTSPRMGGGIDILVGEPLARLVFAGSVVGRAILLDGVTGVERRSFQSTAPESNGRFGDAVASITAANRPVGIVIGATRENPAPLPTDAGVVQMSLADCDTNGVSDVVDVGGGAADCNTNGQPDRCDVNVFGKDCNTNGQPDECEIAGNGSLDANSNGVLDGCETACPGVSDCNTNGVPDGLEVPGGDCNSNGVLDVCESGFPVISVVSRNQQGEIGMGSEFQNCYAPAMSWDGRFVVFVAEANNLVPGDTNGKADVFVKDTTTGQIENVHVSSTGEQANNFAYHGLSISRDGRYVAFTSEATNLVTGATARQAYVRDRLVGQTVLVSSGPGAVSGNGYSVSPAVSDDGRYVAYASNASNLVSGDTNNKFDVFRWDRQTNISTRITNGANNQQADNHSGAGFEGFLQIATRQVVISSDGRYVAFASNATNLVQGDTNGFRDVFVYDCVSGQAERVNVSTSGQQANDGSAGEGAAFLYGVAIGMTPDTRFVLFDSVATNLVPGNANGRQDLFVRDRLLGTTERLIIDGTATEPYFYDVAIAEDGCSVAFGTNVRPAGFSSVSEIRLNYFSYSRATGTLALASKLHNGLPADQVSGIYSQMAGVLNNGNTVVFASPEISLYGSPPNAMLQVLSAYLPGGKTACRGPGILDECNPPLGLTDFVNVLLGADTDAVHVCLADVNHDSLADGDDVQPYVARVIGP